MSPGTSVSSARATVSWSGADEERLAHVRDVEQAGLGAHVIVLGDDAVGILHRHVVAGERHHAGTARDMQRVQRGFLQRRRRLRRIGRRCCVADRDRGGFRRMRRVGRRFGGFSFGFGRLGHDRFRHRSRIRATYPAEPPLSRNLRDFALSTSCAGLTRTSTSQGPGPKSWMAGTSPAMTKGQLTPSVSRTCTALLLSRVSSPCGPFA